MKPVANTLRTSDSTDRTPTLANSKAQTKSAVSRLGNTARRLLNSLMRSLATPHV